MRKCKDGKKGWLISSLDGIGPFNAGKDHVDGVYRCWNRQGAPTRYWQTGEL